MHQVWCVIQSGSFWATAVPIVISAVVAWMTYVQLRIRTAQVQAALFEKRFTVYKTAWDAIGTVCSPASNQAGDFQADEDIVKVWHQAQFLFRDEKVAEKLQSLRSPMLELSNLRREISDMNEAYKKIEMPPVAQQQRKVNFDRQNVLRTDLNAMRRELPELFAPWLNVP
jgi:hypothetical protein